MPARSYRRTRPLLLTALIGLTPAALANTDLGVQPETGFGPVSSAEIQQFDSFHSNFTAPANNDEKDMTWTTSRVIRANLDMYELTGNISYLDQAMSHADAALAVREDPVNGKVDYVTQRVIPGWPYYYDQFTDAGGNIVPYSNVIGQSMIFGALADVALVILADANLPSSYHTSADSYVAAANQVVDAFIDYPDWYNSSTKLFHFPDNARHDEVLDGLRGKHIAYNRMLSMANAMFALARAMELQGGQQATVDEYDAIVQAIVDFHWSNAVLHGSGATGYWEWNYREEGKHNDPPKIEDIGHGGIDTRMLQRLHVDGGSALGMSDLHMQQIANTLMDQMLGAPPHQFCYYFDGSDCAKDPLKANRSALRYVGLAPHRFDVYEQVAWQWLNGVQAFEPAVQSYTEFLLEKQRHWDANPGNPVGATIVYDTAGVLATDSHVDVYACDVDKFPFEQSGHRNSMVEASDGQYAALASDDDNRWLTADPGASDEVFLWVEMDIAEAVADIGQINFRYAGNSDGSAASNQQIWVLRAGQSWSSAASWEPVGWSQSVQPDVDGSQRRSLIDNFADYIDNGRITWGVFSDASSEDLRIDHIALEVVLGDGIQPPAAGGGQSSDVAVSEDSYARRGTPTSVYGGDLDLRAKDGTGANDNDREAFLKYDVSGISGSIDSAILHVQAKTSIAGSLTMKLFELGDGWSEATLDWNNRPALGAQIASHGFSGTAYGWYQVDVTGYVQQQHAGDGVVSIGVADNAEQAEQWYAKSREAGAAEQSFLRITHTP